MVRTSFEEILKNDGVLCYTNVGNSMYPMIKQGRDVLVIKTLPERSLQKYDVVLYKRTENDGKTSYILHRILKKVENGYWIVGDHCTCGEIVINSSIIGILDSIVRDGSTKRFDSFRYKLYVVFWCKPYHFRFAVLKLRLFLYGITKRILKIKKQN